MINIEANKRYAVQMFDGAIRIVDGFWIKFDSESRNVQVAGQYNCTIIGEVVPLFRDSTS